MDGLEPTTLAVAWPADSRSPAVAAFVRAVREIAEAAFDDESPAPLRDGGRVGPI